MKADLVSVIIPALNEAAGIAGCLAGAARQEGPLEIITADGGSRDDTARIAAQYGQVIHTPRGRAVQMNRAAAAAQGEILLFLHADTRLHPQALAGVRRALAGPRTAGGTFTMQFDSSRPIFRLYGAFTRLPFFFLHYGDQGIYIRRAVFEQLGGYREIGLMEDIDLLRRMQRLGRRIILPLPVTTSTRRFDRYGALRQELINIALVSLYLLGVDPDRLARQYRAHQE